NDSKQRKKRTACIDVLESLARLQNRSASSEDDVLAQRWPVFKSDPSILADGMANRRLKEDVLQRFGSHEPQVVEIRETLQFRRDIEVDSGVRQEDSGVHEIRLPLFLARAQARNQAARRHQLNAGAEQPNSLAVPEAKQSARET